MSPFPFFLLLNDRPIWQSGEEPAVLWRLSLSWFSKSFVWQLWVSADTPTCFSHCIREKTSRFRYSQFWWTVVERDASILRTTSRNCGMHLKSEYALTNRNMQISLMSLEEWSSTPHHISAPTWNIYEIHILISFGEEMILIAIWLRLRDLKSWMMMFHL